MIDFWATWCPPCQAPMAHNQAMVSKNKADWEAKGIKIIGLSIDKGADVVCKHVDSKGWTDIHHYWRHTSDCSDVYNVRGVPCVMLIDKNGKVAFKGHPASRKNLEEDFETLASGGTLTGQGTGPEAEEEEDEGEAGGSDINFDTAMTTIDEFKTVAEGFQKDDTLKGHATSMPRSFCVMVLSSAFDPTTKKTSNSWNNYRVLVGK